LILIPAILRLPPLALRLSRKSAAEAPGPAQGVTADA
jgi:hypothetical protein